MNKPSLQELRQAIGALPSSIAVPSGRDDVDFACGRVTELSGAWSSGKMALALAAAARVTAERKLVAWIDARRELYPPAAAARGVALDRLLVVRPPANAPQISRAVEIVGRSRSFALIVVDVPDGVRIEDAAATRLRAAAHGSAAAVIALVSKGSVAAASRYVVSRGEFPIVLRRGAR